MKRINKKAKTNWLVGLEIPKRKNYKTDTWYLKAVYRMNKEKLDPILNGKAKKEKQFFEAIRSAKQNKHLMWKLETKRVTTKQALEHFSREMLLDKEAIAILNTRQALRSTKKENELRELLGIKKIKMENLKWNKKDKVFEYSVTQKKGEEIITISKARITINSYNARGFEAVRIEKV